MFIKITLKFHSSTKIIKTKWATQRSPMNLLTSMTTIRNTTSKDKILSSKTTNKMSRLKASPAWWIAPRYTQERTYRRQMWEDIKRTIHFRAIKYLKYWILQTHRAMRTTLRSTIRQLYIIIVLSKKVLLIKIIPRSKISSMMIKIINRI